MEEQYYPERMHFSSKSTTRQIEVPFPICHLQDLRAVINYIYKSRVYNLSDRNMIIVYLQRYRIYQNCPKTLFILLLDKKITSPKRLKSGKKFIVRVLLKIYQQYLKLRICFQKKDLKKIPKYLDKIKQNIQNQYMMIQYLQNIQAQDNQNFDIFTDNV